MASNPFEEGLRAPPALALLADRLDKYPVSSSALTSLQPLAEAQVLAGTSQRQRWSRCVIPFDSHRGHTGSVHTAL